MNNANFQLLQDATHNMSQPTQEHGQDFEDANDSNVEEDDDEDEEEDEESNPIEVEYTNKSTTSQPATQVISSVTPMRNPNSAHTQGLETVPIQDPELAEALRQLQAGEHIPDQTTPSTAGGPVGHDDADTPIREVRRRAVYTREQKLAAVHYATTTYRTAPDGTRRLVSGPEAANLMNISWTVLGQWIKDANKIQTMHPGAQKQRWAKRQSAKLNGSQRDKMRRMVMYQQPGKRPTSISHTNQAWGQPPFHTPGISYGAPAPHPTYTPSRQIARGPPVSGGWGTGGSLVSYEIPWAPIRRVTQQICSTLDSSSQCQGSDVQFTTVSGSMVRDSTLINCTISASDVGRNASAYQSSLVASKIGDDSDMACCSIKNSIIRNAKLTNCTVINCRITGGQHFGKLFENRAIDGTEVDEPAVTATDKKAQPVPVSSISVPTPAASTAAAAEIDMADADGTSDDTD